MVLYKSNLKVFLEDGPQTLRKMSVPQNDSKEYWCCMKWGGSCALSMGTGLNCNVLKTVIIFFRLCL